MNESDIEIQVLPEDVRQVKTCIYVRVSSVRRQLNVEK